MEHNVCQSLEVNEHKDIFLGQVVYNKDEAYALYQEHAFKMGFSVRKGRELYYDIEKKNTRLKDYYCSKQGFKNNELVGEVAYERADSRTDCKAMVRFNVSKDGVWKITKLELNHNHDFVPQEQRHLLRSMRGVSNAKGGLINSMVNAGGSTSMEIGGCNNVSYHEVIFNHMPNKKYQVTFDSSTMMINCSCHKFDSMGILCSHALRIYNIKGILKIPDQYFLKRWSKSARSMIYEHINRGSKEDSSSNVINSMTNGDDAGILYRNAIMKSFYNLVLETQEHKETQQIMWKLLNIGVEQVQQCIGKLNLNSNAETIENKFTQIEDNEWAAIFNPPLAKTKGMSTARKKGHFEKRKRSTTKTKQNKGHGLILF
ncbi:Zinc finger, PMZ-type [Sesbania bispinosa]|nr:Zinc finger, PMZ-type [Sesbania bispinosa]KAJ1388555.1 Zinc finger, PMZ-type [Sesbania bispinosa]KAJ1400580.1 Zinc finger, PMZ-type [Sesbania bispinosa]